MTVLPTQNDLAVSPELAILAALRVSLHLAIDVLQVVYPLNELPTDHEHRAAHQVVLLADVLRVAVHDYEQLMAGLHDRP